MAQTLFDMEEAKTLAEHLPVAQMRQRGMDVNQNIYKKIYANPAVRDLPRVAALYGCYSSFVVGHKDIFFCYGLSHEAIHQLPIVEAGGWVFPAHIYKKTGYWPGPWFFCRDFNAIKIRDVDADIELIIMYLAAFELVHYCYKRHGMEMPQFVYIDEGIERELFDLNIVIDNKLTTDATKYQALGTEEQLLKDIAIPEWPITQSGQKPGYLAYLEFSAFTTCDTNDRKEKKNYERQCDWNDTFRKNLKKDIGEGYSLFKDVADWLFKQLDARDIPYHVMRERARDVMLRRKNKNELYDFVSQMTDGEKKLTYHERVIFSVHHRYAGIVDYLLDRYVIEHEDQAEIRYGNYLYFSSCAERKKKEGDICCGGCFMFFLHPLYEEHLRKYAKEMGIRLGRPTGAGWTHEPAGRGKWYVVDLVDMPATEMILHKLAANIMRTHFVTLTGDADEEYRRFNSTNLSVEVTRKPWHMYGKPKHLSSFDDMAAFGYTILPKIRYIEKGLLVDNDPYPKTEQEKKDFLMGKHLPTYGIPEDPPPQKPGVVKAKRIQ